MKKKSIIMGPLLAILLLLLTTGCDFTDTTAVVFQSAEQLGGTSGTADSTGLTLSFDVDPTTALTAANITVTGATKGALTGTGKTRTLSISDITVANGADVSVAITSPDGFAISGSPQTAVVYKDTRVAVVFQSVEQIGGISNNADSTALTLTFDVDPTTALTIDNITVDGATKEALTGSGLTRLFTISDITANNGKEVTVTITSPIGYNITPSSKTATVYRAPYIGMEYQGGIIAYILQDGDAGYNSDETHGLIAATAGQSSGIAWITGGLTQSTANGNTSTAIGTGQANTNAMMNQDGYTGGAAKVCDEYTNTNTGTGVYDDWFLPSKDELNLMYVNLKLQSVGGFADLTVYWSSSEDKAKYAWFQGFGNGVQSHLHKSYTQRVRAVRAF